MQRANSKKNILFVNGHLNVGGVERSLIDLLKHLDYNKYNVDLLLLEGAGDYIREVPSSVNIIIKDTRYAYGPLLSTIATNIKRGDWFSIKYRILLILLNLFGNIIFKFIGRTLIVKHYDFAIAYRTGFIAKIVVNGINAKRKICWWHHGAVNSTADLKSLISFDSIIAVSEGMKEILINESPNLLQKISVIPNIVNINDVICKSKHGKNPYHGFSGKKIITVGRFSVEKHLENAVYAALKMIKDQVDFRWYLVGDGEEYSKIEELIKSYNLESCIILCGKKENPYPYIKYADIMVHTSYIESQGLVILEAMMLGTPCVITQSVGPSEFIIDGTNGIMVEPNVNSLVNGINRLINNTKLQDTIVLNGQNTVIENFSPQKILLKIEGLL